MQPDKKNGQYTPDVRPFGKGETEPFVSPLNRLEDRWNWFLGIGVTLILLGILAVTGAQITSVFTVFVMGILLIAGCITKLIAAFWARRWSGFWLSLLVGALYGVIGLLFLLRPIRALEAITLVMSVLFLSSGISTTVSSLYLRFENWGWVLFSGLISLLLGVLLLVEWPSSSLWVLGTFLGVDLLMSGWVWVALACESRRLDKMRHDQ